MSAKYTIRVNNDQQYINIPLDLTHSNINQEDLIESVFVDNEAKKAINPSVDYEKVRLTPKSDSKEIIRVDYALTLKKDGLLNNNTTLKSIGFNNDDIKFKRNNFKKSFLNLMFFDSDIPTKQNYVSGLTLYNRLTRFDVANAIVSNTQSEEPFPTVNSPRLTPFTEGIEGFLGDDGEIVKYTNPDTNLSSGDLIVGKFDSTISNNLLVGQTCIDEVKREGVSMTSTYVDKFNYKVIYQSGDGGGSCLPSDYFKVGTKLTAAEISNLKIPYNSTEQVYLVKSDYKYNNKTYRLYVKWVVSFYGKVADEVIGVYFVANTTGDGTNDLEVTSELGGHILGGAKDVGEIPLKFIVEDPLKTPRGFAEGYYLYHQKVDLPNSLYMRANYNNAKTGISTDLVTTNKPHSIENLISKLHTKYNLKLDGDTYYYELDTNYSSNILVDGNKLVVNLYEIQVL